jgi:hypothetical protein
LKQGGCQAGLDELPAYAGLPPDRLDGLRDRLMFG